VIDSEKELAAFVSRLHAAQWAAVDTEADSLHAYPEKLCLLQVSIPGADELIDPLAGLDLSQLLKALGGRELILHGADYDLRLFRRAYGFAPRSIFDTMEAARLLGHREFGLVHLAGRYLGMTLEKGPQKANWAARPLTKRMQEYGRNDTRFLKPLADLLESELRAKGRLSWHQETCARVIANSAQARLVEPDQVWRISGSYRLNPFGLAVLRELWHWRELQAIRANKPPYFVLSHEILLALATAVSQAGALVESLPHFVPVAYRSVLLEVINRAFSLAPEARPSIRRPAGRQRSETEKRRFAAIKQRRDLRAAELSIDPTLIASRATLELLAENEAKHQDLLMGWQREILR